MARTKSSASKKATATSGKAPRKDLTEKAVVKARKAGPGVGGAKKPHRFRAGTVALRQIKRFQKSTELLCRKLPFQRLVREITQDIRADMRYQASALVALQEIAEMFITETFAASSALTAFKGNVTVMPQALRLGLALNPLVKKFLPDKPLTAPVGKSANNAEDVVQLVKAGHSANNAAPPRNPPKDKPQRDKKRAERVAKAQKAQKAKKAADAAAPANSAPEAPAAQAALALAAVASAAQAAQVAPTQVAAADNQAEEEELAPLPLDEEEDDGAAAMETEEPAVPAVSAAAFAKARPKTNGAPIIKASA